MSNETLTRDDDQKAHRPVPVVLRPIFYLAERTSWVGSISVIALAGLVIVDVASRMVNIPLSSGSDIGAMLMVALIFFAIPGTQVDKDHVSMDALVVAFPRRVRMVADRFSLVVCLAVGSFLTHGAFKAAVKSYTIGEMALGALRIPLWPAKWIIAFSFGLYTLVVLAQLLGANPTGKAQDSVPPAGAE